MLRIKVQRYDDAPGEKTRYLKTIFPLNGLTGFTTTVQRGRALQVDSPAKVQAILDSLERFTLHTFTPVEDNCTQHRYVCINCGATQCQ